MSHIKVKLLHKNTNKLTITRTDHLVNEILYRYHNKSDEQGEHHIPATLLDHLQPKLGSSSWPMDQPYSFLMKSWSGMRKSKMKINF